jgi:2-polyprenyl-3-methyl-5-hydroxy-6-metoxy-1,4-benzoquinol methylase
MDTQLTETVLPEAVQRWSASDYAKNGRFVAELAGAVFAMLAPKPGERILDLGCGDGTLTAEIRAAGADVLGVDLSDELLAVARMKGLARSLTPCSPTLLYIGCVGPSWSSREWRGR